LEKERPDPNERYKKYSGSKRAHYERCAEENSAHPIGSRDGAAIFHDASVKWGELTSRPRALLVQSVRAKGTANVKPGMLLRTPIMIEGGYRDHFEDALHKLCHRAGWHIVASGMDLHKRGRVMRSMIEPGDVVLSCDWRRFDGTEGWLAVDERKEFLEWSEKLFGRDNALREVLRTQDRNTVQAGPLSGKIFGNRGSGTAGTSTGNKLVVLAALHYALGKAMEGLRGVKLFCDGDDTLIVVPKRFQGMRWYKSWARRLSELGLETKIQQCVLDTPEHPAAETVRFCRAGVINTSRGWFLCKQPDDAVKVMTNFRRHFGGSEFCDYISTLSVGMKNVYGDVPILCKFADMFDVGGKYNKGLYDGAGMEYMISRHKSGGPGMITDEHRHSFFLTWGVTAHEQIACEAALMEEAHRFRQLVEAYR
jgi:hypothetical protein